MISVVVRVVRRCYAAYRGPRRPRERLAGASIRPWCRSPHRAPLRFVRNLHSKDHATTGYVVGAIRVCTTSGAAKLSGIHGSERVS